MKEPDPTRDPRVIVTFVLALIAALVLAVSAGTRTPASADATAPTLLDAALDHLDAGTPTAEVDVALEALVDDAIGVGALAHGVLTVVAGGDPISVDPFLACHLRGERGHWAEVRAIWTRAHAQVVDDRAGCDLSEDSPCGLALRLRLQTAAALELAAWPTCDADCALRLEQVRERLEVTTRSLVELGDGAGPGIDVDGLVREAERARAELTERIRTAEPPRADGAGPEVCEPDAPSGPNTPGTTARRSVPGATGPQSPTVTVNSDVRWDQR